MNPARTALVIGSSGAIGAAVARRLAHDGHNILLHARKDSAALQELHESIESCGRRSSKIFFDVRDSTTVREQLTALAESTLPQVVVYAAGITSDGLFGAMTEDRWRDVIDANLHGFFNVMQPLLMPIVMTRWGRLIAVTSISGISGNRGQANYAASKAGIVGAVKSIAQEVARRGVTVNAVAPGIIQTKMTEGVFDDKEVRRIVPMERRGTPEEVAAVISFLASSDSSYLTGQVLAVDGGMT